MSIITEPYMCNVCKKVKQPTDSWLIGKTNVDAKIAYPWGSDENVVVAKWNDRVVDRAGDDIAHLCSAICARDWFATEIGKLMLSPVEPERVEVVAATVPPDETKLKVVSPLS